jgi:hypothetical membrane protein
MIVIEYLARLIFLFINSFLIIFSIYKSIGRKFKIDARLIVIVIFGTVLIYLNQTYSLAELRMLGNYLIEIFMLMIINSKELKSQYFIYQLS